MQMVCEGDHIFSGLVIFESEMKMEHDAHI